MSVVVTINRTKVPTGELVVGDYVIKSSKTFTDMEFFNTPRIRTAVLELLAKGCVYVTHNGASITASIDSSGRIIANNVDNFLTGVTSGNVTLTDKTASIRSGLITSLS